MRTSYYRSKLILHVSAGATLKDGSSDGCTMITSLLSIAIKRPVRKDLAMTGEVTLTSEGTLTGRILPICEAKEKTIAAWRSEIKTIILSAANRRDFDELSENVKECVDAILLMITVRYLSLLLEVLIALKAN